MVALAVALALAVRSDPSLLVPWNRVGDIALGAAKVRIEGEYGRAQHDGLGNLFYRLHGNKTFITYGDRFYGDAGRIRSIDFTTPYYRTKSGFGVGSRIPLGPCHPTKTSRCEHRWHGFVWNEWVREKPCNCWTKVGLGAQSLPVSFKNFLKPWFFINVRHGRVSGFYFASRFVD